MQLNNPILTKCTYDEQESMMPKSECQDFDQLSPLDIVAKTEDNSLGSIVLSKTAQAFLRHSLHLAVQNLFESGTVEELMDKTLSRVTSFDSAHSGEYNSDGYNMRNIPLPKGGQDPRKSYQRRPSTAEPRFARSHVCHRTSSMGVVFGSIWIRISTLRVGAGSNVSSGKFEIITSFIFYPASWLTRVGFRYGVEAKLSNSTAGWQFNLCPVRAVPDDSLIFELCQRGNAKAVELLLQRGDASVRDTSPKGWTPLHVSEIDMIALDEEEQV